jgi:hypothetical protein
MKKVFLRFIYTPFLLIIISSKSHSQNIARDIVCSSGETIIKTEISLTYTLGEVFGDLLTNTPASRYLTIGFIQPDIELKEILDRDKSKFLTVFPNPTTNGSIKLALNNVPDGSYSVTVVNVLGQVMYRQGVTISNNNLLYIDMKLGFLVSGTYFLRATSNNGFKGQVKLVKL